MATSFPKLRRVHVIFLVVFFIIALVLKLWQYRWPTATVELGGETLHVLVADTIPHQIRGLGGRKSLDPYDGMLFLFGEPDRYAFVMRDMRFSIDIIWFLDGKVVDIAPRVPLEPEASENDLRRYQPRKEATIVLEVPAGWAEAHALRIGDGLKVLE